MAKRKGLQRNLLVGASGALLAGGIAALPHPAAADLIIDLRINPTGSTGVTVSPDSKTGTVSGPATVVVNVYGTVTDANANSVSINAVGGSFLSTGPIPGSFAPNGATGWSGTGIPPEGTTRLVGLRTASYDFSGTGSQPGRLQDLDADGDNDLGSPNANAPDDFVYMREASPDNASGTPVAGGKEWKIGSVTFTSTGAGAATQLKFEPRRNAAGNLVPETAWWFEGDMVSGANPDGIAYPTLPGSVLNTANAFVTLTSAVVPTDFTWTGGAGGAGTDFDTAGNWQGGTVPNAAGASAIFGAADPNAGQVILATAKTLGVITFNSAPSYTLSGAALTLNNNANPARIVVTNGSHSILNPISSGAVNIERGAGGGTLTLQKLTATGALTIPAAQSVIINPNGAAAGSSKVVGLTIGAGGSLDLKDNDLVIANTVATTVRDMIAANTLRTTQAPPAGKTTTLGWAQGSDITTLGGLLTGQSFDADDTLVKYTYHGDSQLDGDVDLDDVALWSANFTGSLAPNAGTKTWAQGDWSGDRDVDLDDVALWSANFTGALTAGSPGALSIDVPAPISGEALSALAGLGISVNVVPEPGVLGLVGLLGAGLLRRRVRRS